MSRKKKSSLYLFIKNDGLVVAVAGLILVVACTEMFFGGREKV